MNADEGDLFIGFQNPTFFSEIFITKINDLKSPQKWLPWRQAGL